MSPCSGIHWIPFQSSSESLIRYVYLQGLIENFFQGFFETIFEDSMSLFPGLCWIPPRFIEILCRGPLSAFSELHWVSYQRFRYSLDRNSLNPLSGNRWEPFQGFVGSFFRDSFSHFAWICWVRSTDSLNVFFSRLYWVPYQRFTQFLPWINWIPFQGFVEYFSWLKIMVINPYQRFVRKVPLQGWIEYLFRDSSSHFAEACEVISKNFFYDTRWNPFQGYIESFIRDSLSLFPGIFRVPF